MIRKKIPSSPSGKLILSSILGQGFFAISLLIVGATLPAEVLGHYSTTIATGSLLSILMTLQIERIYVTAPECEVKNYWLAIFFTSTFFATFGIAASYIYKEHFSSVIQSIAFALSICIYQATYYALVRLGNLSTIASSKIIQGGISGAGVTLYSLLDTHPASSGLVIASIVGWIASTIYMLPSALKSVSNPPSMHKALGIIKDNPRHYIVAVPTMFALIGAKEMPLLAIRAIYGPAAAGAYAILNTLLYQPIGIIGKAFSAEIGHLAGDENKETLEKITKKIKHYFFIGSLWAIVASIFLAIWSTLGLGGTYVESIPIFPAVAIIALMSTAFGTLGPFIAKRRLIRIELKTSLGIAAAITISGIIAQTTKIPTTSYLIIIAIISCGLYIKGIHSIIKGSP